MCGRPKHPCSEERVRTRKSWWAMLWRCENPKCNKYANYGGKGIKVCPEWHTFDRFVEDMGYRPRGATLGRLDHNKGYEPGNCSWQERNWKPRTLPKVCHEAAELLGCAISTIMERYRKGDRGELLRRPIAIRKPHQPRAPGRPNKPSGLTAKHYELANMSGICSQLAYLRVTKLGWSIQKAISVPPIRYKKRVSNAKATPQATPKATPPQNRS